MKYLSKRSTKNFQVNNNDTILRKAENKCKLTQLTELKETLETLTVFSWKKKSNYRVKMTLAH